MKRFILYLASAIAAASATAQTADTDSIGIYALQDGQYVRITRLNYDKVKASGGLASAFTMGIAPIRSKFSFRGNTSSNVTKSPAKFRFYFGGTGTMNSQYAVFSPMYSIKDFGVAQFTVKRKTRELNAGSVSVFGTSMGVSAADVETKIREVRDGVYEVELTAAPGEYCFFCTSNNSMGYGSVYDFTIKGEPKKPVELSDDIIIND